MLEAEDIFATCLNELKKLDLTNHFFQIGVELLRLHYLKSLDYGTKGDTYKNFRGAEEMGIPAWKGAFIRLQDKVKRVCTFSKTGQLANEGVIDSFNDLAVYAIICRDLFEEDLAREHTPD